MGWGRVIKEGHGEGRSGLLDGSSGGDMCQCVER